MSYFVGFYDFSHGFPGFPLMCQPPPTCTHFRRARGAVEDGLAVVHGKGGVGDLSDDLQRAKCYLH